MAVKPLCLARYTFTLCTVCVDTYTETTELTVKASITFRSVCRVLTLTGPHRLLSLRETDRKNISLQFSTVSIVLSIQYSTLPFLAPTGQIEGEGRGGGKQIAPCYYSNSPYTCQYSAVFLLYIALAA